jgi:hypothetical protein
MLQAEGVTQFVGQGGAPTSIREKWDPKSLLSQDDARQLGSEEPTKYSATVGHEKQVPPRAEDG